QPKGTTSLAVLRPILCRSITYGVFLDEPSIKTLCIRLGRVSGAIPVFDSATKASFFWQDLLACRCFEARISKPAILNALASFPRRPPSGVALGWLSFNSFSKERYNVVARRPVRHAPPKVLARSP